MVCMGAVAEVEPKDIGTGLMKRQDGLHRGTGGAQGGDDPGVSLASHEGSEGI